MAQVSILERPRGEALAATTKNHAGAGVVGVLLVVISSAVVLFYQQSPPRPVAANAPAGVFSSARAMETLRVIAQRPHPIGSAEHESVRNFLVQQLTGLGLQTEVQTARVRSFKPGNTSETVNNIIAVLKGTDSGKAVLLAAHYDTVQNSPGANDDGVGVATLLETARALKSGQTLKNDLVLLLSDGEESNLLGAKAFVTQHPLASQVALALNFEARGASGPAVLFETSENNRRLIDEFAKAVPYPNGNSLAYEVYRWMPNSTDMQIFKTSGIAGLNFAYFDDADRYHSAGDDLQNVSEPSLQHQGTYALALARRFGNASLDTRSGVNAVYFDLLGRWLVHYSMLWVLPLTAFVAILFAAVTWLGHTRKKITLPGMGYAFLAFTGILCVAITVAALIWGLNYWLAREAYPGKAYLGLFVLLGIGFTVVSYSRLFRKVAVENLAMGALACWLFLLIVVSFLMPGGSYLLLWPLLFSLAARTAIFTATTTTPDSIKMVSLHSLVVLPAIVLLVPMIYQIFVALGFFAIVIITPMLMLLLGLLVPHFALFTTHKRPAGA